MASEIRVNKIENRSGLGTVTFADTGVDIAGITTAATLKVGTGVTASSDGDIFATGVCTATSFSGDGSALTGIAATDNVRTGILDVAGVGTFRNDVNIPDKIVHLGDTNTAIRFPADDTITTETGGSERTRITSAGRLGIGENSPDALLHLSTGASSTCEIRLTSNNTGSGSGDRGRLNVYSALNDGTAYQAGYVDIDRSSGTDDIAHLLVSLNDGSSVAERLRITGGGDLKFNSGYGSVGTAYGVRAWVKYYWNSGTPTISGSGNVSSLTDTATGDATVNFSTALPDTVYAAVASGDAYGQSQAPLFNLGFTSRTYSTTAVTVNSTNYSGSSTDIKSVQVIVVR